MKQIFTNWAASLLAAPLTPTSTIIQVTAGFGLKFPNPQADEYFLIVLENEARTVREIVKIISRTGDTLYVDTNGRGLDGTSALSWATNPGTLVDHRMTAMTVRTMQNDYTNAANPSIKTLDKAVDYLIDKVHDMEILQINHVLREIPVGLINDINKIFVIANTPALNTEVMVTINGLVQDEDCFSINDKIIELSDAPLVGDVIKVTYSTY